MEAEIPFLKSSPAVEIPRPRAHLESLDRDHVPYTIVTSGTKALLSIWLKGLALPPPQEVTVAEDVNVGKPDPEGHMKARSRLCRGLQPDQSADGLVMEDAPAGVRAGKAAGCKVLAVTTTHTVGQVGELKAVGPDWLNSTDQLSTT
jgi:glycerol 3-phosphatase-1